MATKMERALARAKGGGEGRVARGGELEAPEVVALTERYQELRRQALRDAVDTAIELGGIVMQVRARMRENFDAWLAHVGTTDRTARNYAALARLAEDAPAVIQKWKELGPSK